MPVLTDITQSYRRPQRGMERLLSMGQREDRALAILMGGMATLLPQRKSEVARLGIKAVLAGTLSNLMSASLAGLFLSF